VSPPGKLPEQLQEELKRRKSEILARLRHESTFLQQHVPQATTEVFPEYQGLLIKSSVLGMSVWIVRTREEGEELAHETGHPALLLDDVLKQRGKTTEEVRATLLPVLIMSQQ